ncbi:hypothetical protein S40288_11088 [Stachybotrys chartarum IBT 40288]|nr:hypothetical protein S40288_11088 [Stachybotrys chartarum IBT 40288]
MARKSLATTNFEGSLTHLCQGCEAWLKAFCYPISLQIPDIVKLEEARTRLMQGRYRIEGHEDEERIGKLTNENRITRAQRDRQVVKERSFELNGKLPCFCVAADARYRMLMPVPRCIASERPAKRWRLRDIFPDPAKAPWYGLDKVREERHDSRGRRKGIRLGLLFLTVVLERALVARYNLRDPRPYGRERIFATLKVGREEEMSNWRIDYGAEVVDDAGTELSSRTSQGRWSTAASDHRGIQARASV